MTSDGVSDPREAAAIQRQVASHPLFAGLGETAARTLIDLSTDAIRFAGSCVARTPAIAKGLPARIHRLAAYGMASEVAVADQHLAPGELQFLEALRIALRIAPGEAEQIIAAARAGQLAPHLEDRYLHLKSLVPIVAEVFALRALVRGNANDDTRFAVRDFFVQLPDLALSQDDLDTELYRAFRRPRAPGTQIYDELARLAHSVPDPVDRYWIVVYALVAEEPAAAASWRVIPFAGVLQAAFQIGDTDMELAAVDALTFSPGLARPR